MKFVTLAAIAGLSFAAVAGTAQAKGCVGGAVVGGVAGHVAGRHTVLGAAAGCAIGHHEATKKAKMRAQARNAPPPRHR